MKLQKGDPIHKYDANGKLYTLQYVQEIPEMTSRTSMTPPVAPPHLETTDGLLVECLEPGRYRIVDLDIVLTSDDPTFSQSQQQT
jgi:hypothetical protein